jgi:hypothetical protein
MELGGLEPPTSWVRSRRPPALSFACLQGFPRCGRAPSPPRAFGQFPLISTGIGPKNGFFGPTSASTGRSRAPTRFTGRPPVSLLALYAQKLQSFCAARLWLWMSSSRSNASISPASYRANPSLTRSRGFPSSSSWYAPTACRAARRSVFEMWPPTRADGAALVSSPRSHIDPHGTETRSGRLVSTTAITATRRGRGVL